MALVKILKKGSVDRRIPMTIINATTGLPDESLAYNTAGLSLWYRRSGGAKVAITPVSLASLSAAHADGGFIVNDDGDYRLDAPDAAFASGADAVRFGGSATGLIVLPSDVMLTDFDLETALTASSINAAVVAGQVGIDAAAAASQTEAAAIADAVLDATADAHEDVGTVGERLSETYSSAGNVEAKLPSDGAKMAGEGATAKTLDDVTDAATITLTRDLEPPLSALTFYVSRRSDGTYACDRPLRLRAGSVEDQRVGLSMKRLGNGTVTTVGTAAVSGSGLTATSPGRFDEMATLVIGGTIASGASHTVDVAVTFEGNVFFVRLVVEAVD